MVRIKSATDALDVRPMTCITKFNNAVSTLEELYALFDMSMAAFPVACAKQCADCCTCNVTATSLEIVYIYNRLDDMALDNIRVRLARAGHTRRCLKMGFVPSILSGLWDVG